MSINTKYFKWKEFKEEFFTQLLSYDNSHNTDSATTDEEKLNQSGVKVLVKDYFLEDTEDRQHICEVKYLTEKNLTAWKKEQSANIELTEMTYQDYKALRDENRVYQIELAFSKSVRGKELEDSYITMEELQVDLNSNEEAMTRFGYLITLANAKYNLAVASGTVPAEAVKVYDTEFSWKTYQNEWKKVKIRDLINALEKSVMNLQVIWTKYN